MSLTIIRIPVRYYNMLRATYLQLTQRSVAPGQLWCLMFPQSMTQTEHQDTTAGCVVSVDRPASTSTHSQQGYFGYVQCRGLDSGAKSNKTVLGQALIWRYFFSFGQVISLRQGSHSRKRSC